MFEHLSFLSRGAFSFDFSSASPREEFYSTSQLIFTLGFLSGGSNPTLLTTNELACIVLEKPLTPTTSIFTVSHRWKSLVFTPTFTTATLTPHSMFASPESYTFRLKCTSGSTPDDTNQATNLSA